MSNLLFIVWEPSLGLNLGPLQIRYYSLMFALAFYFGYKIMIKMYKKEKIDTKEVDSLLFYTAVGILLGARLGHVFFYDWAYFQNHLEEIILPFRFSPKFEFTGFAGLASHGAFIGGVSALLIFSKKKKKRFLWVLDRVVIVVALGGAFVRLGNLINSEIIGKPTNLPWGFIFKNSLYSVDNTIARHPSQLYEAIGYFLIFIILWKLYNKGKHKLTGYLSGVFMVGIWGIRFLVEFLKENQSEFENTMFLNMGQILSIPFVILGMYIIYNSVKKNN